MNPKIKVFVDKLWPRVRRATLLFASVAAFLGSLSLVAILAVVYWNPIKAHQQHIESKLGDALFAESVELSNPRLVWSWKSFSVGVQADRISIRSAPRIPVADIEKPSLWLAPWAVLAGKLKFVLESPKARIEMGMTQPKAHQAKGSLPGWLKFLSLTARLKDSELVWDQQKALSEADVSIELNGLPGPIRGSIETQVNWNKEAPLTHVHGPIRAEFGGYFQSVQGKMLGLKLNSFELNLNELKVQALGLVDKPRSFPLFLRGSPQVFIDPDSGFKAVELKDFEVTMGREIFLFDGQFQTPEEWSLKLAANRREVSEFRVPLRGLTEIPFRGVLEATAEFSRSLKQGNRGTWKTVFSNFRVSAEQLPEILDPGSKGELRFSFMSEGVFEQGKLKSPRTELHVNADEAQLELAGGQFIKPAGDRLNLLLKGEVVDGDLMLEKLVAQLHTFELLGEGRLNQVTDYFSGKESVVQSKLQSNLVDLVQWSSYFPLFRKIPLEGFVQVAGQVQGKLGHGESVWDELAWRLDRLSLSKIRGSLEPDALRRLYPLAKLWNVQGPFRVDLIANGRGVGPRVDRATGMLQADAAQMIVEREGLLQKRKGVPLNLDLQAELSPNRLVVRKGRFNVHELALDFSGALHQSQRSLLQLRFLRPIQLENWRDVFISPDSRGNPLGGRVDWVGGVGFDAQGDFESRLDWRTLALDGRLVFSNVHGSSGILSEPFKEVGGELSFSRTGLVLRRFRAQLGQARLDGGLELETKDRNSFRVGTLWSERPLRVKASLSLPRWSVQDFRSPERVQEELPDNIQPQAALAIETRWMNWIRQPRWMNSEISLFLRTGAGDWGIQTADARMEWKDGRLQLNPFVIRLASKGEASGVLEMQGRPFFEQKKDPEFSTSLKLSRVPLENFGSLVDSLKGWSGILNGELTATFSGVDRMRWAETRRGRLNGQLQAAQFSGQNLFQKTLEEFFAASAARDYFIREASADQCLGERFDGQVDLGIAKELELNRLDLVFPTGSQIQVSGTQTQLRGVFRAGSRCIRGDARKCLAGPSGQAELPFVVKPKNQNWSVQLDLGPVGERLTECLGNAVARSAKQAIERAVPDELRKKIQDVFN